MSMTMTNDEANALLVAMLEDLRFQLFEPTDYSIMELCDIMLAPPEEDLFDGDPDSITPSEATQFALIVALRSIRAGIELIRPNHFKSDLWRYGIVADHDR